MADLLTTAWAIAGRVMPEGKAVSFIANNRHYFAATGRARGPKHRLGHEGREFSVRLEDGRMFLSNNVWWDWQQAPREGTPKATMQEVLR